ncbi:hypothetical protein, partial [Allomesorhizobium alhagi]
SLLLILSLSKDGERSKPRSTIARAATQRGKGEVRAGDSLLSFRRKAAAVEVFARAEKSKLSPAANGEGDEDALRPCKMDIERRAQTLAALCTIG